MLFIRLRTFEDDPERVRPVSLKGRVKWLHMLIASLGVTAIFLLIISKYHNLHILRVFRHLDS